MESLYKKNEGYVKVTEKKHKAETHCFQVSEGFQVEEKLDSRIITEEELESMSQ